MNPLAFLPDWAIRWGVIALLCAAFGAFCWTKGANHVQDKWDADTAARTAVVVRVQAKQAEAAVKIVTRYIDRVQVIEQAATQLSKEIPHYVTLQADAGCTINRGFVRVLDAAATHTIPEPAGIVDASPAPVTLAAVAESVTGNYANCNANAEQLSKLQEWVMEMQKAALPALPLSCCQPLP